MAGCERKNPTRDLKNHRNQCTGLDSACLGFDRWSLDFEICFLPFPIIWTVELREAHQTNSSRVASRE